MGLQLNLVDGEDGTGTVPIVLEDDIVDDEDAIEAYGDAVAYHADVEGVPFAERIVGHAEGGAAILLVVVESARAHFGADIGASDIPDLHLRRATEVDTSIGLLAFGVETPIDEHLEIAVLFDGADVIVACADVGQEAVLDFPVIAHTAVGVDLLLGQLNGGHTLTDNGVLDEPLPASEVAAVEMTDKALDGFFGQMGVDGLALLAADVGQGTRHEMTRQMAVEVGVSEGDGSYAKSCLATEGWLIEVVGKGGHGHEGACLRNLTEKGALLLHVGGLLHLMTEGNEAVLRGDGLSVCEGRTEGADEEEEDGTVHRGEGRGES